MRQRRGRVRTGLLTALALTALVVVATALSGCAGASGQGDPVAGAGGGQSIAVGSSTHTIDVGGLRRSFRVYRPARLADPAPLVIFLHGGFGSGAQAERSYHWDTQADAAHFLVAYPNGLHRAWNTEGGGCCGEPARAGVDDVAFIAAVVHTVEAAVPVDPDRVYATGISNGGIMAYTLACRTDLFAAIGPDSATELAPCPDPRPLSVIHIHGTADHNIPYNGGRGDGVAHIDGPSVPSVNRRWRIVDDCAPPLVTTQSVVTTSLAQCPHGRSVELITIDGAGHQWPGASENRLVERLLHLDPPSTALDATHVIWQFFAQSRRSA